MTVQRLFETICILLVILLIHFIGFRKATGYLCPGITVQCGIRFPFAGSQ